MRACGFAARSQNVVGFNFVSILRIDGKHKARLFLSILGMTADHADELQTILLEVVKTHEVRLGRQDAFGQRYTLDFSLTWQNSTISDRVGWVEA